MSITLPKTLILKSQSGEKHEFDTLRLCGVSSVFRDMVSMPKASQGEAETNAEIQLSEDSSVIKALHRLMMGEQLREYGDEGAIALVAAIHKYDMQLLEDRLLTLCREGAAAPRTTGEELSLWTIFVTAAHLGHVVTMTDCLKSVQNSDDWAEPTRWTLSSAAQLPLAVYVSLIRSWHSYTRWERVADDFAQEYQRNRSEIHKPSAPDDSSLSQE